ncbi:hypothetical protein TeGR_g6156 [Tetraparma gracilis]|uniref:Uncharacterized protein n=1 Tax=Tetraparma gracilis TaxID=2962635 RepID=A0ABQ6MBZ4_9STRA|nr:hypothetical protein TeGR_g6156 [Tetraparma gracilis]
MLPLRRLAPSCLRSSARSSARSLPRSAALSSARPLSSLLSAPLAPPAPPSLAPPSSLPRSLSAPVSFASRGAARCFSSKMDELALKKRLEEFQDLFVEARLCIEDVVDSQETTYFDEDAEAAQEAVDAAVGAFQAIVGDIEDKDQKNSVLRGNGLKVEQLKGELKMALDGGH